MSRKKNPLPKQKPKRAIGPYLAAALICENILEDKDNVLSVVRIVDKFIIRAEARIGERIVPLGQVPAAISFQVLIALRHGKGKHILQLVGRTPKGEEMTTLSKPFVFPDGRDGALGSINLKVGVSVAVKENGQHWIDVFLDKVMITRMPLLVVYQSLETGSSTQSQDRQ